MRGRTSAATTCAACALIATGAAFATGAAQPAPPVPTNQPFQFPQQHESVPAAAVADGFTFAAGGDLLGPWWPRSGLADPELDKVAALVRGADAAFANLESNLFDLREFAGYPAAENGGFEQGGIGGGPLMAAGVAADLKAFGLDLLSTANNHSLDWNVAGMLKTARNLEAAGLVYAGTGSSRAEARAPRFLETPRGRVALVAAASTVLPMAVAGPGGEARNGYVAPRPGVSALRHRPITLVPAEEFAVLQRIAARQGRQPEGEHGDVTIMPNEATFTGQTFRRAERAGLTYELDASDRTEILASIRSAKRSAHLAVFSIHAHETASGGQEHLVAPEELQPADFLQPLFHEAIDVGADIVVTHAPHVLRGIEIYKGKPIFYGLGSLYFELGTGWPAAWLDSVLAVTEFRGGQTYEIRLHPLDLGAASAPARARLQEGVPRIATGAHARRILEELRRASAAYGTEIAIENDIGVIRAARPQRGKHPPL